MSASLTLTLLDGTTAQRIEHVASLVAADGSGSFGLQPGHAPLLTVLEPGLLRYRTGEEDWTWLACAGGMLRCTREAGGTAVAIVSRRFLRGTAPEALQAQLEALLANESEIRLGTRQQREQVQMALQRRLQELAEQRQ
jgi:F-type H+-transporting ATPase subunit epsilon